MFLLFKNKQTRVRVLRIAVLSLVAWSLFAWVMARALVVVTAEPVQADALVVLSGSSVYLERVNRAAQLWKEGRAPKILLTNDNERSGWSSEQQRNPLFVERESEALQLAGIPAAAIEVLPQPVSSTYEEAVRLRDYATTQGLRSVLIVTSAYHSRRALWTMRRVFEGSGVEVGVAIAPIGEQSPSSATWWLHPGGWRMIAGEYVKLVYYWLHYR